jgi:hypothetical protein
MEALTSIPPANNAPAPAPISVPAPAPAPAPVPAAKRELPPQPTSKKAAKKGGAQKDEFVIYGPGEGPRTSEEPDAALHGLRSMWDIPDLDKKDMTREEYYKAVQGRLNDMKKKRQESEGYTREAASDYLDKLNRKAN